MSVQNRSLKVLFAEGITIAVLLLSALLGVLLVLGSLSGMSAIIGTLFIFFAPGVITVTYYAPFIKKNLVELVLYVFCIYLFLGVAVYLANLFIQNAQIAYVATYTLFSFFCAVRMLLKSTHKIIAEENNEEQVPGQRKNVWFDFILILVAFAVSRYIYYLQVPAWTTLNTDALTHLIAIKEIFVNHIFSFDLTQVSSAFTVMSYLPNFHLMFGPVLMSLGNTVSVQIYNILEMAMILVSTFSLYAMISNKGYRFAGLFLAIMHLFVFERIAAYTSLFLLPQTLAAFLAELLLLSLLFKEKLSLQTYIMYGVVLVTSHFLIGTLGIAICLAFALLSTKYISTSLLKLVQIITLYIAISVVISGTTYLEYFSTIVPDFQARISELVVLDFNLFVSTLFQMFGVWVGISILLSVLSLFAKDKAFAVLSVLLVILITVILVQVPYSGKLLVYVHYLGITFLAWGVTKLERYTKAKSVVWLVTILLGGSMSFPLLAASDQFKRTLYQGDYIGLITESEKSAFGFIEKLPEGRLISDPLSMTIFESQTKHRSLGGIYTSVPLRAAVWNMLNQKRERYTFSGDKPAYVIITSRTVTWAKQDENFIQGYANQIWNVPAESIRSCADFEYLGKLLYATDESCIYQAN